MATGKVLRNTLTKQGQVLMKLINRLLPGQPAFYFSRATRNNTKHKRIGQTAGREYEDYGSEHKYLEEKAGNTK